MGYFIINFLNLAWRIWREDRVKHHYAVMEQRIKNAADKQYADEIGRDR